MKTEIEVSRARDVLVSLFADKRLHHVQRVLFQGMSVALQWVSGGDGGQSLQDILDGRPIEIKSDEQIDEAMREGEKRLNEVRRQ